MGKGIATIIGANKRGGFRISEGGNHVAGLLQTALGSGDSSNPFQNLGLGERMIFEPLTVETFAPVQDRIREIFDDFKENEIGSLQERPDNLKVIETDKGEAAILVFYVDLSSGTPYAAQVTGTSNGLVVTLVG